VKKTDREDDEPGSYGEPFDVLGLSEQDRAEITLRMKYRFAFRDEFERRGLDGIGFVLGVDLDEARRIASGAFEIPLATLRAHLLAMVRSRSELDEMRREVLRDHPGAVL